MTSLQRSFLLGCAVLLVFVSPTLAFRITSDGGVLLDSGSATGIGTWYGQEVYQASDGRWVMLAQTGDAWGTGCDSQVGDQVVVFVANAVNGPYHPRVWDGSGKPTRAEYRASAITPCQSGTNWGIGTVARSLWGNYYLTLDAGIGGDDHKFYVYMVSSTNGIDFPPVPDQARLILDGSTSNQLVLYTTLFPVGLDKMSFFFWHGTGGAYPTKLGHGVITVSPLKVYPPIYSVELRNSGGNYVTLTGPQFTLTLDDLRTDGKVWHPNDVHFDGGTPYLFLFTRFGNGEGAGCSPSPDGKSTGFRYIPFSYNTTTGHFINWLAGGTTVMESDAPTIPLPWNSVTGALFPTLVDVGSQTHFFWSNDRNCIGTFWHLDIRHALVD